MDWDKLYSAAQRNQFILSARLPISWMASALTLKHAADRLHQTCMAAEPRYLARTLAEGQVSASASGSVGRTLEGQELEDHWDLQLQSPCNLLVGFSIENLLKGLLVMREPELIDEAAGKIRAPMTSHNLTSLAQRSEMTLNADELRTLQMLSLQISWRGRYPVNLDRQKMLPYKQDGEWITSVLVPHDKLEALWGRVYDQFEEQSKKWRTEMAPYQPP